MRAISSVFVAFSLLASGGHANAQQACAPRDNTIAQLEKQYSERVLGRGLTANGKQMIELFVSDSGSWTMLDSDPTGRSCVVASGEDWQGMKLLVGDPV